MENSVEVKNLETRLAELAVEETLERAKILLELALFFKSKDQDKVIKYGKLALGLVQDTNNKVLCISILNELTWAYNCTGGYREATKYLYQTLDLVRYIGDKKNESSIVSRLGIMQIRMGRYDEALDFFMKALAIKEKLSDRIGIAGLKINIANAYYFMGWFEKGIQYTEEAIEIYLENNLEGNLPIAYNGLGALFLSSGERDKSLFYYRKSLDLAEKFDDKLSIAHALINIGSVQRELGQLDVSLENLRRALEIEREMGDRHGAADTLRNIGLNLALSEETDLAVDCINQGIKIAEEIEAPDLLMNCYESLSFAHEKGSNYMEALRFHKEYKAIFEKIFTEENAKRFNQLQLSYEKEAKEKESEIYRLKNVELVEKNTQLNKALSEIKALSGLLPICAVCKKVRSDSGYWEQIETYISHHSEAEFSHGLCPDCAKSIYPEEEIS